MTWTTAPKTWNSGDNLSSSTTLNTELRDRFSDLYARPTVHTTYQSASADYNLTANTWTDVDAVNLIATMTTNANSRVWVSFDFMVSSITGGALNAYFDVTDGTARSGGTNGTFQITNVVRGQVRVQGWFTGVSNASHTYKLQYQVSASTTLVIARLGFPIVIHAQEM